MALVLCSFALIWNYRAIYHQATDSLGYLYRIQTGQSSFHPHHLIYIPIVEILHRLVRQLCGSCDAMVAAQIHNTLWSSLVVGVTFVSARVLYRSTGAALATALFIGFSQGLIFYAWHAESFSAGLFWLTAMAGLLVVRPLDESSDRWLVPLAVCYVAAILFHQSNVLIGIPLVPVLLLTSSRHRIRRASLFLGASGAVTLLTYFTVFVIDAGRFGLASFSRFMTRYGHSVRTDWGSLEYFSFDGLLEMLESQAWVLINLPGRFEEPAARVLGVLLLAIAGWHLYQLRVGGPRREIRIFLLGWLAVYLLFFLWWLPREEDFFVATLTPIVWLGFWAGRESLSVFSISVDSPPASATSPASLCSARSSSGSLSRCSEPIAPRRAMTTCRPPRSPASSPNRACCSVIAVSVPT